MKNKIVDIVPTNREERIKVLQEATDILKKEFVGLDSIIDDIKEAVSAWYITPEIITRPVVISLWGMTGTGKSSVVRRLLDLVGLNNSSMFFDCGECTNDNKDISNNICDTLGLDSEEYTGLTNGPGDTIAANGKVFVFDEFQYAKTLNEDGTEEIKSSLRPIWSIIDSGIIDISDSYSWAYNQLVSFVDDFGVFAMEYPDIAIEDNQIKDRDAVKLFLENLGFMYSDRIIPGITSSRYIPRANSDDEEDEDPYRPVKLMEQDKLKTIIRRLNETELGSGLKAAQRILGDKWTSIEFYQFLKGIKNRISRPKQLDCSNSLVFVIGNLDEAFHVSGDTNPDMDADMFYSVTSKVTVSDIKEALKKRFRAEQIARLGNNLIKYPTLKREHFQKIIRNEVSKILDNFNKHVDPIKVNIEEEVYELLYVEGVFPTQGVRPIFTTINTILTPYLSKILINKEDGCKEVTITVKNKEDYTKRAFKIDSTILTMTFDNGKSLEYEHYLQLGSARNPLNRKKRYASSIHEAGHAIVYATLMGKAPDNIVSVSTDHGGFCSTYDEEKEGEIDSRKDLDNSVCISLGGYEAESLMFDRSMVLLGSGSDIESAWTDFSEYAYKVGYFEPVSFSNHMVDQRPDGVSSGLSHSSSVKYYGTNSEGKEFTTYYSLDHAIDEKFKELRRETAKILSGEHELLIRLGIYLGEYGSMTGDTFMKFVEKYGNNLNPKTMEEIRKNNSPEYYLKCLEK